MNDASKGPASYENWRAQLSGVALHGRTEIPIYSDVDFSLPVHGDLGPYRLQHAHASGLTDPALVLFADDFLDKLPDMSRTRIDGFTGTYLGDEIAALLALSHGRRFVAGDPTRTLSDVSKNEWIIMGDRSRPMFFRAHTLGRRSAVLPRADEPAEITTERLATLPGLRPETATSVLRAAVQYRDALWVAETEPGLAWLLLVAALEVGAVHQHIEVPPLTILRSSKPRLVERLEAVAPALAEDVASDLARELRATARFLGFMEKFMPPPPERRPSADWAQLDWSPAAMKKALSKIYSLRSLALHEGVPFPPPMCWPPELHSEGWAAPIEKVMGLAAGTTGGVWMADDLPMSLHSFEYIARGALLNWWGYVATSQASP